MRGRKTYYYFLTDASGRSYYVDGYDVAGKPTVKKSTEPKPLKRNPKGWQDKVLSFGRNSKYFGLNRSFSVPLTFVKEGAEIIRNRFYGGKSFEEKLFLSINKWDHLSDTYKPYYNGELDLTEIDDDPSTGVTVNLIEGGLSKQIKAFENTVFEVPCDGSLPEHVQVNLDGILFNDKYNYAFTPGQFARVDFTHLAACVFLNREGDSIGVINGTQSFEGFDPPVGVPYGEFLKDSSNYILLIPELTVTYKIKGKITITGGNSTAFVSLSAMGSSGTTGADLIDITTGSNLGTQTKTFNLDATGTLLANEKLFINIHYGNGGITVEDDSLFSIEFNTKYKATKAWGFRPADLFKRLINDKISNGQYKGVSNLLEQYKHLVLISGDSLRNIEKAVIKTTLSDLFTSFNVPTPAAMGVTKLNISPFTEYAFLEKRESVFDSSVITMNVGEVEGLKISVAKDYIFSDIKIGYPNVQYEERAGRKEFNTTAQWKMPITKINKSLDLLSIYRADPHGIEYTRANTSGKDTTDNKADNDTFFVNIEDAPQNDGSYNLRRETYTSLFGLSDDLILANSYFNIEDLTPKRAFLAHGPWFAGCVPFLSGEKITFQTIDKNNELSTTRAGVTITEKADARVDQLGAPLFYPYVFTFKTKVPVNFIDLMNSAVNGHIEFKYYGRTFYGFPIEVSVKPSLNDAQQWKLLASPRNDLSQLQSLEQDPTSGLDIGQYGLSIPKLSPVQFVPVGQVFDSRYHHVHMDQDWYVNQLSRYSSKKNYYQKYECTDLIELQCITKALAPVQIDIIDCKGKNIATIPFSQKTTGKIKSPFALFQTSINLSQYTFRDDRLYYILVTAGIGNTKAQMISEPLQIKAKFSDTILIEYSNDKTALGTVFAEGYRPKIRIEGMITDYIPGGEFTSFEDETGSIEILDGYPSREFKLILGGPHPIPPYLIDKVNRLTLLSNVTYDGYGYTRTEDGDFEAIRIPGSASAYWIIPMKEADERESISLDVNGNLNKGSIVSHIDNSNFGENRSGTPNIITIELPGDY